jgi:hypothetical protein
MLVLFIITSVKTSNRVYLPSVGRPLCIVSRFEQFRIKKAKHPIWLLACWADLSTVKLEAVRSPSISINRYQTTWCHITEVSTIYCHSCENLRSHPFFEHRGSLIKIIFSQIFGTRKFLKAFFFLRFYTPRLVWQELILINVIYCRWK